MIPPESARQTAIERRWPRHQWDASGRSRWASWDWRNYLYIVICALLVSGTLLTAAATVGDGEKEPWWLFGQLAESPAGLAILTMLVLVNGWLVDTSLADRTLGEGSVPAWLRWVRRAVVTLPVLGLYAIPVWRRITETRPSWAFRTFSPPAVQMATDARMAGLARVRTWSRRLRRRQGQSLPALVLWVILGQIAPWLSFLSWVTTPEILSPAHQKLLIALTVLCHVAACYLGLQYGAIRATQVGAGGWRATALRYAPLSFLLPFPFFVMGLLVWMAQAGEDVETLVVRVSTNRSLPAAPIRPGKGSAFRLFHRLTRGKSSVDESPFLAFCRLKTFLLALDAAALGWVLARRDALARGFDLDEIQLFPLLVFAALGVIIELIILSIRLIGWFWRRALVYQPYGRSLTLTQLALLVGFLFGPLVAEERGADAGLLLMTAGLAMTVASALLVAPISFLLLRPERQALVNLAWIVLFFELFVTGLILHEHPELAPPFLSFFTAIILLSPAWSLALFLGLKDWLLHPFKLRHVSDRRLPGRARAALATVVLTAILPLGGIAIPFWIYAHHRLWPEYERSLGTLKESPGS